MFTLLQRVLKRSFSKSRPPDPEGWSPYKPWTVDLGSRGATVRNHLGHAIARCDRGDRDARLIAALPSLLNVLHDVGDIIEAQLAHGEVSEAGWSQQLDEVVAAIELAEGINEANIIPD